MRVKRVKVKGVKRVKVTRVMRVTVTKGQTETREEPRGARNRGNTGRGKRGGR